MLLCVELIFHIQFLSTLNTVYCNFSMSVIFAYLGTNIKNQNSIQEEIKSRLKSGNTC